MQEYIPAPILNLFTAVVIVIIAIVLGNISAKVIRKLFQELELNEILKRQGVKVPVEESVASIARYVVYFVGIAWALIELGIGTAVLQIILWAVLLLLVVFIALAFKDLLPNFVTGIYLHQKGLLKKGEFVRIDSVEGKVVEMTMLDVKIETKSKEMVIIPNNLIVKSKIIKSKGVKSKR